MPYLVKAMFVVIILLVTIVFLATGFSALASTDTQTPTSSDQTITNEERQFIQTTQDYAEQEAINKAKEICVSLFTSKRYYSVDGKYSQQFNYAGKQSSIVVNLNAESGEKYTAVFMITIDTKNGIPQANPPSNSPGCLLQQ